MRKRFSKTLTQIAGRRLTFEQLTGIFNERSVWDGASETR